MERRNRSWKDKGEEEWSKDVEESNLHVKVEREMGRDKRKIRGIKKV